MKDRVTDFFATLWPLLMILTVHLYFSLYLTPFVNLYVLAFLLLLTDLVCFYLYRGFSGERVNRVLMVFRLLIFYLVILWGLYKLLSGELFRPGSPLFSAGSIYTVVMGTVSWLLTLFFGQALIYRENFMSLFDGIPPTELPAKTRQYSYELKELQEKIKKVRLVTVAFTVVALVILVGLFFIAPELYSLQIISYLTVFLFCLSFIFFTRGLDEETLLISEGIRLDPVWTTLKERRYFLILLCLAIPSLLLGRMEFALPPSLIADFFNWLGSLIEAEPAEDVQRAFEMPQMPRPTGGMGAPMEILGEMEQREPLLSDEVKRIIKLFFLGSAAAAFVYFLLAPFLRRSSRRESKRVIKKSLSSLGRYFLNLISLFKFQRLDREKARVKKRRRPGGAAKEQFVPRRHSPAAREKELPSANKVLRAFNRLVRWGGRRKRTYTVGLSPSDYLISLVALLPRRREQLGEMALFLNRYFYSDQIIDGDEIDRFILSVGTLIKEERRR